MKGGWNKLHLSFATQPWARSQAKCLVACCGGEIHMAYRDAPKENEEEETYEEKPKLAFGETVL